MLTSSPQWNHLMLREQESQLDEITDAQVSATISYLQVDLECIEWMYEKPDPLAFGLGLALLLQLLGCIGTLWVYQWTH